MAPVNNQKADSNKLARKLLPNQSIRSEQKKSNPGALVSHQPSPEFSNLVIDCSQKTESENETILNDLIQMIDRSADMIKSKGKMQRTRQRTQVSLSSDPILLDFADSGFIEKEKMLAMVKKNHAFFCKSKNMNHFVLGLNSILGYLENLSLILVQIAELVKLSNSRFFGSSSNQNSHDLDDETRNQVQSEGNDHGKIDADQSVQVLRSLKLVKYVVVFNNHFNNQHHSIIGLISPLIKSINQVLSLITSSRHVSGTHNLLPEKSIELVGIPVHLIQPILKKFCIKRLSCFAILDSAPGLENMIDRLKNSE